MRTRGTTVEFIVGGQNPRVLRIHSGKFQKSFSRSSCWKEITSPQLADHAQLIGGMVGLGGLEPPTSPLSGVRSSHLSYRPNVLTPILT